MTVNITDFLIVVTVLLSMGLVSYAGSMRSQNRRDRYKDKFGDDSNRS